MMGENVIVTTDKEITSRLTKTIPTPAYDPEKVNKGRVRSKSDCSKLIALQEALQDPIKVCEGM